MKHGVTLFDIWGVRQMARDLDKAAGTVHGWKKEGRIPSVEQPLVLAKAEELGLPITAENVVFPLGRPSDVALLTANSAPVACDTEEQPQRTGAGQ